MIYEFPSSDQPIKQGDIFKSLPHVFLDPSKLIVFENDQPTIPHSWLEEMEKQEISVLATVEPKYGIVVNQDCDTSRDTFIAFFEICPFSEVTKLTTKPTPEWWAKNLTKAARENLKWFYLPSDERIGFSEKMAANFQTIIPVKTRFLVNNLAQLRIGRLNPEADEHFREHIAQYFRRYPYDEWYPLNKEEFEAYKKDPTRASSVPRPYQE